MRYIGIDPGVTGALAVFNAETGWLDVYDMPVDRLDGRTQVMQWRLWDLLRSIKLAPGVIYSATIEDPNTMPSDGRVGAFNFGFTCGVIQAIVTSHGIPKLLTRPLSWKIAMGLTSDKDEVRRVAQRLFPGHAALFDRKKDHGRAEAALLALHGMKLHAGTQKR